MKRQTIIILTIVSSLLSLAMILLSYFGVVRYIGMHVASTDKLIENYSKLPKAHEGRVVLSFAVQHKDMNNLKPMFNSLLDQTVKVDQLALVVPMNQKKSVPEHMKQIVSVFPAGKDYGAGNKLIPILLKEKECGTIIIAVENDIVYGKDFIEKIIAESDKHPGVVLTDSKRRAILTKPEYYGCEVLDHNKKEYSKEWFIQQAKKAKQIDYGENYKKI